MLSSGSHSTLTEHPSLDIWKQGKPHHEFSNALETVTRGTLLEKVAAGALLAGLKLDGHAQRVAVKAVYPAGSWSGVWFPRGTTSVGASSV